MSCHPLHFTLVSTLCEIKKDVLVVLQQVRRWVGDVSRRKEIRLDFARQLTTFVHPSAFSTATRFRVL